MVSFFCTPILTKKVSCSTVIKAHIFSAPIYDSNQFPTSRPNEEGSGTSRRSS